MTNKRKDEQMNMTGDMLEALNSRIVFESFSVMNKHYPKQKALYESKAGTGVLLDRELWLRCALEVRGMTFDKEKAGTSHGPA